MMKVEDFLENIKANCSEISYLCAQRLLDKLCSSEASEEEIKELLADYTKYNRYLNDFAGVIYNKHASSIVAVYMEICEYLDIDIDNEYTLEYVLKKLDAQDPTVILTLTDDDLKIQTVEYFEEKLNSVLESNYYNSNKDKYIEKVEDYSRKLDLMKSALQLK